MNSHEFKLRKRVFPIKSSFLGHLRKSIHGDLSFLATTMVAHIEVAKRVDQRLQRAFTLGRLQLTLPQSETMPSAKTQGRNDPLVALSVALNLLLPEFCVRLGHHKIATACMSMPKATVDKNHGAKARKHYIGPTRKVAHIHTETKPASKKITADKQFRTRVTPLDGGHASVALFLCHAVHVQRKNKVRLIKINRKR